MDWILVAFNFWNTFSAVFGCSINILLIYLCLYKSPKSIQIYGTLIINFAITDFVECFFHILLEFRLMPIPMEAKIAWQFNGLCQLPGLKTCQLGLGVFLSCISHGLWSLLLSFSYRLYILKHSVSTRKHLILVILIVYIPSFIEMISIPINLMDTQEAIELIHRTLPSHDLTGTLVTALDILASPSAFFAVAHIALPIYPVYIAIFILRRKIVKNLMINANVLSKETKAVHTQMLKCLTYQAFIPIFMLIAVCLYFLCQLGIVNTREIELSVMTTYIPMPVVSSLTYICFVRPYREFCKRLLCYKTTDITTGTKEARFNSSLTKVDSSKPQTVLTIQC